MWRVNIKLLGTTLVVFHNHSSKVKSQMMTERVIDNCGSKSTIVTTLPRSISVLILSVVKEQRVYGSWQEKAYILWLSRCSLSCLRYIQMITERYCLIKIHSKSNSPNFPPPPPLLPLSLKERERWGGGGE